MRFLGSSRVYAETVSRSVQSFISGLTIQERDQQTDTDHAVHAIPPVAMDRFLRTEYMRRGLKITYLQASQGRAVAQTRPSVNVYCK